MKLVEMVGRLLEYESDGELRHDAECGVNSRLTHPNECTCGFSNALFCTRTALTTASPITNSIELALKQAALDLHEAAGRFSCISKLNPTACSELTREAAHRAEAALAKVSPITSDADGVRAELQTGIANIKDTLIDTPSEDMFWHRYWVGYLKAYESLLEKLPALLLERGEPK